MFLLQNHVDLLQHIGCQTHGQLTTGQPGMLLWLPPVVPHGDARVRGGSKKANRRAHPDSNHGPADLRSAALATKLCAHLLRVLSSSGRSKLIMTAD